MSKVKYDQHFLNDANACGDPFPELISALEEIGKSGTKRILDLGCGQGRDALSAARRGHKVVAVDISSVGIAQLLDKAKAEELHLVGIVDNILSFEINRQYDVVLLDRVLHMLPGKYEICSVLEKVSCHTANRGHVLIADVPKNLPIIEEFFNERQKEWKMNRPKKGFLFAQKQGKATC